MSAPSQKRNLALPKEVAPWSLVRLRERLVKIGANIVRHGGYITFQQAEVASTKRGDRYADCRIRTGFSFHRHNCYATGDREWSSGESRLKCVSAERWLTSGLRQRFCHRAGEH